MGTRLCMTCGWVLLPTIVLAAIPIPYEEQGNVSAGGSFSPVRHLLARVCGHLLAQVLTNFRSSRAKHRWMASLGSVGLSMLALHCRVVSRGTSTSSVAQIAQ